MTFKTRRTILMIHDHEHLTNVNCHIALELKCQSSQILYLPNLLIPTFSFSKKKFLHFPHIFFPLMDISFNINEKKKTKNVESFVI